MARKSKKESPKRSAAKSEERLVQKYYPAFENLILLVIGRGEYWEAIKRFAKREVSFRGGLFAQGFIFLVSAAVFIGGAVVFATAGAYIALRELTGSPMLAAFSMAVVSFSMALLLLVLMAFRFRKMLGPHPESELARNRERSDHIRD